MGVLRGLVVAVWRLVYYKLTHVQEEKWRVLAGCLALSCSLWFLLQMNKTYSATLRVPLSFTYDRALYTPRQELPSALWLAVQAKGWPLALAKYGPKKLKVVVVPDLSLDVWRADTASLRAFVAKHLAGMDKVHMLYMPEPVGFVRQ